MRIFNVRSDRDEEIYSSLSSIPRQRDDVGARGCLGQCGNVHRVAGGGYAGPPATSPRNDERRFVGPPVAPPEFVPEVDLGVPNFPPPPPEGGVAALPIHYVGGARPKVKIGLPPLPELGGGSRSDSE